MRKLFTILSVFIFGTTFAQNHPIWQKPKFTPIIVTNRGGGSAPDPGPQTPITVTTIPFSSVDLTYTPNRGEEQWHGGNEVNIPNTLTQVARNDVYKRSFYPMNQLYPLANTFDFSTLIADMQDAINNRQGFSFGLPLTFFDGADGNYYATFGGGQAAFPQWLRDSIDLLEPSAKCWKTNGTGPTSGSGYWVIPWQSNVGFRALERLLTAVKNLLDQTYNGVRYGDIINTIDIRYLGNYGEGHSVNIVDGMSNYPSGTRMTTAVWQRVIDDYCAIFSNYQLQIMIAAFDCHRLPAVIDNDQAVAYYALSKTYGNGKKLGWRKDSYGSDEPYLADLLQNNTNTFGGMRFDTAILNRYKYAPITGEPNSGTQMTNLGRDVRIYHTNAVGNSNYNATLSIPSQDTIRLASKLMGNRVYISSGTISTTITKGSPFSVTLNWQNVGLTPPYINWTTTYSLRNASNVEVYSTTSSMTLKYFQPAAAPSSITDFITIPTSVASGTYSLVLIMKDPTNYRLPFPIYNSAPSRNSDGSYTLKTGITL